MVTRGREQKEEELEEGGQKGQTSSHKISPGDVMYNTMAAVNTAV